MDTLVKSKDGPKADLINRAYKMATPLLDAIDKSMKSGADKKPTPKPKADYDIVPKNAPRIQDPFIHMPWSKPR